MFILAEQGWWFTGKQCNKARTKFNTLKFARGGGNNNNKNLIFESLDIVNSGEKSSILIVTYIFHSYIDLKG